MKYTNGQSGTTNIKNVNGVNLFRVVLTANVSQQVKAGYEVPQHKQRNS
jgi:hypothetical protein